MALLTFWTGATVVGQTDEEGQCRSMSTGRLAAMLLAPGASMAGGATGVYQGFFPVEKLGQMLPVRSLLQTEAP